MSKHLTQGDFVPDDLTPYWVERIDNHRRIYAGRPQHRCVRWLMEHVVAQGYSKRLFPYASVVGLLISVPKHGLISYERTLRVSYDDLHQHVVMRLTLAGSVIWETTCQVSEIIDAFEHFLNERPDWSNAARQN